MPVNKIGYPGSQTYPAFQAALTPGEVFPVPAGQGIVGTFGSTASQFTGSTLTGQYYCTLGPYLSLQQYDPNLQFWRNVHAYSGGPHFLSSDGTNYRIANTTGCPIGALITNAGSSLTNGFNTVTVTPSAGGSTWNTIVGGAINTTISVSGTVYQNQAFGGTGVSLTASGGSNYTRPPIIVFGAPPNQGNLPYILPTAYAAISAGSVSAITVTNQGAGLQGLPTITVINQPGDTTGGGAVLGWTSGNSAMVGSGTLLWMGPATYNNTGTGLTAVPTFTFSPASAIAATAIMNFTVTGYTVGTAGVAYGTTALIQSGPAQVAGTAANTNPNYDKLAIMPRMAQISNVTTGGAINTTAVVADAGFGLEAIPPLYVQAQGSIPTTAAVLTATVGGQNDFFSLQPV